MYEDVAPVFESYPDETKAKLIFLRQLILDTATETDGVGALEETLKWGQPSYLTRESKSGSTIRIDQAGADSGRVAVYFNCQTTLVDTFRQLYPDEFAYEGDRAIVFEADADIPLEPLKHCVSLALTYHADKKRKAAKKQNPK